MAKNCKLCGKEIILDGGNRNRAVHCSVCSQYIKMAFMELRLLIDSNNPEVRKFLEVLNELEYRNRIDILLMLSDMRYQAGIRLPVAIMLIKDIMKPKNWKIIKGAIGSE